MRKCPMPMLAVVAMQMEVWTRTVIRRFVNIRATMRVAQRNDRIDECRCDQKWCN